MEFPSIYQNVTLLLNSTVFFSVKILLYRVPCQCRALSWPFVVINQESVCS